MAMQRRSFVKGYLTHEQSNDSRYLRVEESYDGQNLEIFVGDNDLDPCVCDYCDCDCTTPDVFGIDLNREQVKELHFCLTQLHFIDKPQEEK